MSARTSATSGGSAFLRGTAGVRRLPVMTAGGRASGCRPQPRPASGRGRAAGQGGRGFRNRARGAWPTREQRAGLGGRHLNCRDSVATVCCSRARTRSQFRRQCLRNPAMARASELRFYLRPSAEAEAPGQLCNDRCTISRSRLVGELDEPGGAAHLGHARLHPAKAVEADWLVAGAVDEQQGRMRARA
jgi:hypothetical protein